MKWILFSDLPCSPSENNCFSTIAWVLPNFVTNSVNKEFQRIAHILLHCVDYLYQDKQAVLRGFLNWINKNFIPLFWSVLLIFLHFLCSSQFNFLQLHLSLSCKHLRKCEAAILKFGTLPVITLCIIIIARFDAILDQSEHVHLYYHPSNCTNGI